MRRIILIPAEGEEPHSKTLSQEIEVTAEILLENFDKEVSRHAAIFAHESSGSAVRSDYLRYLLGHKGVVLPFETITSLVNLILAIDAVNEKSSFIACMPHAGVMEFVSFWNDVALEREYTLAPTFNSDQSILGLCFDAMTRDIFPLTKKSAAVM